MITAIERLGNYRLIFVLGEKIRQYSEWVGAATTITLSQTRVSVHFIGSSTHTHSCHRVYLPHAHLRASLSDAAIFTHNTLPRQCTKHEIPSNSALQTYVYDRYVCPGDTVLLFKSFTSYLCKRRYIQPAMRTTTSRQHSDHSNITPPTTSKLLSNCPQLLYNFPMKLLL